MAACGRPGCGKRAVVTFKLLAWAKGMKRQHDPLVVALPAERCDEHRGSTLPGEVISPEIKAMVEAMLERRGKRRPVGWHEAEILAVPLVR